MTQPVCIECGTRVPQVMREFSRGVIQLAKCVGDFLVFSGSNSVQENPSCLQLVDSYVECDSTIIFIDLVLLKRQAYRHLLFNSSKYSRGMSSVPAILNVVYLSHFLSAQGPIIKLAVLRVFMDICESRGTSLCLFSSRNILLQTTDGFEWNFKRGLRMGGRR